jgi:hypothetical protein
MAFASSVAIFLGSFLLFLMQPVIGKMILPWFGGTSAVWTTCMLFFQVLLLAGYAYAHLLATRMSLRQSALAHVLLLAAAASTLPIALHGGQTPPAGSDPSLWLVGVFALSVGLPFFALSAHGPLLQAWFARSGHARAADPYFLYAASNIITGKAPRVGALAGALMMCLLGAVFATQLALLTTPMPQAVPPFPALVAVVALGVFSTALGSVGYVWLVQRRGPVFMSMSIYLAPLWATGLGVLLLGERPGWTAFAALALVLAGVGLTTWRGVRT